MLLSIVACDDYKNEKVGFPQKISVQNLSEHIELVGPVPGASVAEMRNCGVSLSSGQWIFFKDKDCEINISEVVSLVRSLEKLNSEFDIIGGTYRVPEVSLFSQAYNRIQRQWVLAGVDKNKKAVSIRTGSHLLGGALLVRAKVFETSLLFSEIIGWGGEETEWLQRARERGFKAGVSYKIVVRHNSSLGVFGFLKRAWFQSYNPTRFNFNQSKRKLWSQYLRTPWRYFLPTVLFFMVAGVASCSGRVLRPLRAA